MRSTSASEPNPIGIQAPVTSPSIRLAPADRVIERTSCWRPACRAEFPGYNTIIFTITGKVVAHCHRRMHDDLGYRADVWKYGEVAA